MKAETQESGVLTAILAETAERMSARALERPEWERLAARAQPAPSLCQALAGPVVGVIAEVKRRSPSAGEIRAGADAAHLAHLYAGAGARGISVVTEAQRFGGSLEDLMHVARAVGLPTLRKDFIIDPIQVYEARMVGAAAILLIVRALTDGQLTGLSTLARQVGLETLVEVHSEAELERAVALRPDMIGVNARDLDTLVMDPWLVAALLPKVPPDIVAVAESGLKTREDVERVASLGADAVLVGTAVAGAEDPGEALKALVGVPKTRRVSE